MFSNVISFEGLEQVLRYHVRAVRHEDKVTLLVTDNGGKKILYFNPYFFLYRSGGKNNVIAEFLPT